MLANAMSDLRYQEALDYLYSFVDYGSERSDQYSADVFELDRIRRLLSKLDDPHRGYQSVHIAGTKGKGSVAALIASCLRQAGYRTGLYTSPHLLDFTERIQVNGQRIDPLAVAELVDELKPLVDTEPGLTTYELMTALGFLHFQREEVEVGVFEVGLGGRLDSTNVIHPIVTVITSISYDHTHLLGDTIEEIAAEKGGIIKRGVPVVIAPQRPEAARILRAIAEERGAPIVEVGVHWSADLLEGSLDGQRIRFSPLESAVDGRGEPEQPLEVWTPLVGQHQVENAAAAYAALRTAEARGLALTREHCRRGFARVWWPGRFQVVASEPTLVVDAAHNGYSARRLQQTIAEYFPGRPLTVVFGASEDKDIEGMLAELAPAADRIICTQSVHPRAAEPEVVKDLLPGAKAEVIVPVRAAIERALETAPEDGVVLATGSLFVVGEVLDVWANSQAAEDRFRHAEGERP